MAKSTDLSLVEDEPVEGEVVESTAEVVEDGTAQEEEAAPVGPTLEERLALAEVRLLRLEQTAHSEHSMEIGPNELAAIGNALKPLTQQIIIDHLKEHLGMAPPAIRGDA